MANPNCGACGHMNTRGFCNLTACIFPCHTGMGGYINKPQTNADRIRSMTDEELAKTMHDMTLISTEIGLSTEWWEQWLKSPVEVDDG